MPGGRLTQQERKRIAQGLVDGLAYAEIARLIGRPTSTVTREVMRNGGPVAYRAERAQRATEQRSRRRTAPPAREARPGPREAGGRDPEAVRAYEETLTEVFLRSGLPRMAARVQAALALTDSGGLTAAELVERLGISPASVSKAVAFLESQGLVRRHAEGRRERYVIDNGVWYESILASIRSNDLIVATAREGVRVLGAGTPAAIRLENTARFLDFLSDSLRRAAEEARDVLFAGLEEEAGAREQG
ncbi:helix-turn-helix domain-containing protein [Streptomyces sp. NRRL F-5630]|uniref:GbsR/MarR family transcriptional regulator n=1 Tax=Streptomyces sp. NRRL F-5630 TaxID=1463864 RepID=UPI003EBCAE30